MKKLNYLLSLAIVAVLFTAVGCDGGDDPGVPAVDQVGENFAGSWSATSVTFGSPAEDRTVDYGDFSLTATYSTESKGGTLAISGGPVGFRPFSTTADSWTFVTEPTDPNTSAFSVTRDSDGAVLTISNFSAEGMNLSFTLAPGGSTSRTDAVEGTWNFTLVSQ